MLTFEKVLEIFADYLAADKTIEVYISRHGCVRVEFDQDFHYCTGEVCHTPRELFDLLSDDYRTYLEIELTKGRRELTEDDIKRSGYPVQTVSGPLEGGIGMKILKCLLMIVTAPVILVLTLFCLALHGADLHIRSGAWPAQHCNCSTWRGCAAYLFSAERCDPFSHGIF